MNKKKWLFAAVALVLLFVVFHVIRSDFREEERMLRTQVRESIQEAFPEAYLKSRKSYGLHTYKTENGKPFSRPEEKTVILVHGLDDPGIIWKTLAPVLANQGYSVWLLTYPNDQPIGDSSIFFAEELRRLASKKGVKQISVVCHSMGGLVTREMLTNTKIGYAEMEKKGQVPQVNQFIMVGTPNHGSSLSLFRIVTEIRDQVVTANNEGYLWLQSIFDGLGEAGIELLPDSVFLRELNERPLPEGCRMLIIAGVMSPPEKDELKLLFNKLLQALPGSTQPTVSRIFPAVKKIQNEVGDGLVSVASARLAGVPFRQVQGTHVSIIRNLGKESERTPPAIPIIVKELENH